MKHILQNTKNSERLINNNFKQINIAAAFSKKKAPVGLTFYYYGGTYLNPLDNKSYDIADGSIALTANQTNYLQINTITNTIVKDTTKFYDHFIPLYECVCGASTVDTITPKKIGLYNSEKLFLNNTTPFYNSNLQLQFPSAGNVQMTDGYFRNSTNKYLNYIGASGILTLTNNSNNYIQIKTDGASADPYWDDVIFYSHFEELVVNTDNQRKNTYLQLFGNTARSTTYKKFGTYSLKFDGSGDYTLDESELYNLAHNDFTIEFFASFANVATGAPVMLEIGTSGTNSIKLHLATSLLTLTIQNTLRLQKATAIPLNTMNYYCLVKKGGATKNSFQLFFNTTLVGTVNDVSLLTTPKQKFCMGYEALTPTASTFMNGYIDELRITKGVARYWNTITVPTAVFPESPYSYVINTTRNEKYFTLYNIATDASGNITSIEDYQKSYKYIYNSFGQNNVTTIAANTVYSYTHNQRIEDTEKPLQIQALLKCKTAELGFAIGDEVAEWATGSSVSTANQNLIISSDYTQLKVAIGNNIYLNRSNTTIGTLTQATLANWELVFRVHVL